MLQLCWDRDILHEQPCVKCNNGLRWQQGQVWLCCSALLCLSGFSCSRWALQTYQHSFGSEERIPVPSAVQADRISLHITLMKEKRLSTQWQHWERGSPVFDGFLGMRMQHAQCISRCSKCKEPLAHGSRKSGNVHGLELTSSRKFLQTIFKLRLSQAHHLAQICTVTHRSSERQSFLYRVSLIQSFPVKV